MLGERRRSVDKYESSDAENTFYGEDYYLEDLEGDYLLNCSAEEMRLCCITPWVSRAAVSS